MAKKITVSQVAKNVTVFGPTEIDAAEARLANITRGTKIFRSDYLDKLDVAVKSNNEKYLVAAADITIERPDSAKGIDGDHPYVTFENPRLRSEGPAKMYRAWRYIAIVD